MKRLRRYTRRKQDLMSFCLNNTNLDILNKISFEWVKINLIIHFENDAKNRKKKEIKCVCVHGGFDKEI